MGSMLVVDQFLFNSYLVDTWFVDGLVNRLHTVPECRAVFTVLTCKYAGSVSTLLYYFHMLLGLVMEVVLKP